MGAKGAPFYRVVVAPSTAGRNGSFNEIIGTYNPTTQPKHLEIKNDRALHWLLNGAQPTETVAYLLKKVGVLDEYFGQRPKARKDFAYLDKTTAATSVSTAIDNEVTAKVAEAVAEEAVSEGA
jgi:small subunit ribosomal protein S16